MADSLAASNEITNSAPPAVTGWRMWVPVGVMMSCSCLSYIDRQALAVISPMILSDTRLSGAGYADAISIFSIVYMLANPLWGSLLDYVGLRTGMLIAVGIWTIASVSHAWVGGFLGFAAARAVLAFGEGATFPGGLRAAADSLPVTKQSRGLGISYSGAAVGAIVAPLIIIPIALHYGWRGAFWFTGALGCAWLVLWWAIARPPLIRPVVRTNLKFRWPDVRERRFWLLVFGMGLGGAAIAPTLYLCPLYLHRALSMTEVQLAEILWIPALIYECGYYFWGWIADRYVRDNPRPLWIYMLMTALALVSSTVTVTHSRAIAIALLSWGMFVGVGFVVASLHVSMRAYPKAETGMVSGIGSGAWSAVVALLLLVYARWIDRGSWTYIFVSLSLMPVLGTTLWWWIGRNGRPAPRASA
jgi:MFS transporter, ACS family, hexuronate transporter